VGDPADADRRINAGKHALGSLQSANDQLLARGHDGL
jgi:hypothetical protein